MGTSVFATGPRRLSREGGAAALQAWPVNLALAVDAARRQASSPGPASQLSRRQVRPAPEDPGFPWLSAFRAGGARRRVTAIVVGLAFTGSLAACSAAVTLPPPEVAHPERTASPGASARLDLDHLSWTRIEVAVDDLDAAGPLLTGVPDDGFLAVAPTGRTAPPAVLRSPTGLNWAIAGALPDAAACPACANSWPLGIASSGSSAVVIGKARPITGPVIWVTSAAAAWRRLGDLPNLGPEWPTSLAGDPNGYLASVSGGPPRVLLGTSDGIGWRTIALPAPLSSLAE